MCLGKNVAHSTRRFVKAVPITDPQQIIHIFSSLVEKFDFETSQVRLYLSYKSATVKSEYYGLRLSKSFFSRKAVPRDNGLHRKIPTTNTYKKKKNPFREICYFRRMIIFLHTLDQQILFADVIYLIFCGLIIRFNFIPMDLNRVPTPKNFECISDCQLAYSIYDVIEWSETSAIHFLNRIDWQISCIYKILMLGMSDSRDSFTDTKKSRYQSENT